MLNRMRWISPPLVVLILAVGSGGCSFERGSNWEAIAGLDQSYLSHPQWNDGLAEVAFYRVERQRDQYGRDTLQSFDVGTYLVKHDFDLERQSKALDAGIPAFKYSMFYRFESGSYEYRRHYVVNAAQADLRPLRMSFTSFDWCSNLYREIALGEDGRARSMMRSDDYGNDDWTFSIADAVVTPEMLPLLARAITTGEHRFSVLGLDGSGIRATIGIEDSDDRYDYVRVRYESPVHSMIAEETDLEETYIVERSDLRLLVALEGATGRYRMSLVEALRSAYWDEDLFERLEEVEARP